MTREEIQAVIDSDWWIISHDLNALSKPKTVSEFRIFGGIEIDTFDGKRLYPANGYSYIECDWREATPEEVAKYVKEETK